MRKKIYTSAALLLLALTGTQANAQSKIKDGTVAGTSSLPLAGAIIELESSNKGAMMPRVSLTATTTWGLLGTDSAGMIVYNNNPAMTGTITAPTLSGGVGFYYWDGDRWVGMSAGSGNGDFWRLNGNSGTTPPTSVGSTLGSNNYWGTTDAQNLALGTNGTTRMIFDIHGSAYGGGNNTFAKGNTGSTAQFSFAYGNRDSATANSSVAMGYHNKSTANGATTFGGQNIASAQYSVAVGLSDTTSGDYSFAANLQNNASGLRSAVFGTQNQSKGNQSFTVGISNINNGNSTIIAGSSNRDENDILSSVGYNAIFGTSNIDSSSNNLMAGQNNVIYSGANWSVALGRNNTVAHHSSIVLGTSATTTRNNQLVLGFSGGVVMSPLPTYATDAAADADASLPSGSLYKLTGSRGVYQKP